MNEPVKNARKPRLTVEDAWPHPRALLVLADDDDKADIIAGYRNAAEVADLRCRAERLRRDADSCDVRAAACEDFRDEVLARLKQRAADLTNAERLRRDADSCDVRAEADLCIDHREAVLETLRKRAADLTK